jgi:hypothetical protein
MEREKRETERDRERERDRDRQRDRQREREKERDRERQRERDREREKETERERQRERDRSTEAEGEGETIWNMFSTEEFKVLTAARYLFWLVRCWTLTGASFNKSKAFNIRRDSSSSAFCSHSFFMSVCPVFLEVSTVLICSTELRR